MQKKGPRLLWLWISLAVIAILLIGAYVGVSVWIHNYLRSPQFVSLVSAKTGDAFRAQATFSPLSWQGSSVYADSLLGTGNPGSIVSQVRADQIRADVDWRAVYNGAWRLNQVDVLRFEGTFRPGSPEAGRDPVEASPPVRGLEAWLPQRFELGELKIARAHIGFLGQDGNTLADVRDSALQVKPEGEAWTIAGNDGTLNVTGLPELAIGDFRTRMQGDSFYLSDANFRLGEVGKIKASGEFADNSKLIVEWSQIDVSAFLDAGWKSRLSGLLAGTANLQWPAAGPLAGKADGTFTLTEGMLQNLPLLDQIALFTRTPQFRHMPLQELSGKYQWSGGKLVLTNVVMDSKGLLRIEGDYQLTPDGMVLGTLQVGVTPQTLQWLPGSRERVFTEARRGYVWTTVHISGRTDNIQEDLSGRLKNAMKDELIDQGTKALEQLPDAAVQGAKGVLDVLTPLVP